MNRSGAMENEERSGAHGSGSAGAGALRRVPAQQRSRERVERILETATKLIERGGSDALRMSEVADRAGISIGSLYQYFPEKGAVIRALAERYNAQGRACIEAELAAVEGEDDLRAALARLTDEYYEMFLAEPVMRDIWAGTQADVALRGIDQEDVRENGRLLADTIRRLRPRADAERIETSAFLVMHLVAATVRMAITLERRDGDALIAECKRLLIDRGDLV